MIPLIVLLEVATPPPSENLLEKYIAVVLTCIVVPAVGYAIAQLNKLRDSVADISTEQAVQRQRADQQDRRLEHAEDDLQHLRGTVMEWLK